MPEPSNTHALARRWFPMLIGLHRDPRITVAGKPESLALAHVAMALAAEHNTDGQFHLDFALREAGVEEVHGKALIASDFFHGEDHECPDCEQPRAGLHIIHGWLTDLGQKPAESARTLSEARRAAGRRGAEKRWAARTAAATAAARDVVVAEAPIVQEPPKPPRKPRKRGGLSAEQAGQLTLQMGGEPPRGEDPSTLTSKKTATRAKVEINADAKALCKQLADHLVARGHKRPAMTRTGWYEPMTELITTDGYTVEQVRYAIDYCQNLDTRDGQFFAPHIRSAGKLKKRFGEIVDKIMIAKQRKAEPQRGGQAPRNGYHGPETAEDMVTQTEDLYRQLLGDQYEPGSAPMVTANGLIPASQWAARSAGKGT